MGDISQNELDALFNANKKDKGLDLDELLNILSEYKDIQQNSFDSMLSDINIKDLSINVMSRDELKESIDVNTVFIKLDFSDGSIGEHGYFVKEDLAKIIASKMMDSEELDESALSCVQEICSTALTGAMLVPLSEKTKLNLITSPGEASLINKDSFELNDGNYAIIDYALEIEGSIYEDSLRAYYGESVVNDLTKKGDDMSDSNKNQVNAQSVQMSNFTEGSPDNTEIKNITLLMDVFMEMTVELGRTKRLIKDILAMGEGTIIELDKLAGENVDILVNHKLIAKGEVVVIDENFGVRVTEIISKNERMNSIN